MVAVPQYAYFDATLAALAAHQFDALVAIGCANEEVARRLSLSVLTIKSYLKSAMCKLGSRNRTEAVRLARQHGLLP